MQMLLDAMFSFFKCYCIIFIVFLSASNSIYRLTWHCLPLWSYEPIILSEGYSFALNKYFFLNLRVPQNETIVSGVEKGFFTLLAKTARKKS